MATVRLRPASPDAVPACHRPPRRSMPHPRQVAPTNEGERVGYGLVSARPELSLLDQEEEWPLGAATQANTWEDWVPKVSWGSVPVTSPFGLALLGPHVARELRCSNLASGGLGRLRLGRVKYIPRRLREDAVRVSPLPNVCIVLITRDSSEIRWVYAVPEPGGRIHGRFPGTWLVVDEVLKSGVTTYTVFGSTAPEGLVDQARDAVERVQGSFSPTSMRSSLGRRGQVHHLPPALERGG